MRQIGGGSYRPFYSAAGRAGHGYNSLCALMIVALAFIPLSSAGNLVRLFAVVALFAGSVISGGVAYEKRTLTVVHIMLLSAVVPFLAVSFVEGVPDYSAYTHELQRICFNALLILTVAHCRVRFRTLYRICLFMLLSNLAVQALQWMGVAEVTRFITQYYLQPGESTIHVNLALNTGLDFRSGSIFLNPNVYMVIPLTALCVILQAQILRHSLIRYVWVAAALLSLLLTGSRTALVVAVVIISLYIFKYQKQFFIRWISLLLILLGCALYGQYFTENFRVFSVGQGVSDSLGVKWSGFVGYLQTARPLYFLTGSLSSASVNIMLDSEWGYMFSYFGLLGLWWYVELLKMIWAGRSALPFQAVTALIVICAVAATASVVLCMPVFGFFCLVALAKTDMQAPEVAREICSVL